MHEINWGLFLFISVMNILSPGPAVLLSISNSINYGAEKSFYSTLGNTLGITVIALLSTLGLSAILKTNAQLFMGLKIIGAAYLIFLGIKQWRSDKSLFNNDNIKAPIPIKSDKKIFLGGLFMALTNPKAILFFTAFFPQFINVKQPLLSQFIILMSCFALLSFSILMSYAFFAAFAKQWLTNDQRRKTFNKTSGSTFILLGLRLLK